MVHVWHRSKSIEVTLTAGETDKVPLIFIDTWHAPKWSGRPRLRVLLNDLPLYENPPLDGESLLNDLACRVVHFLELCDSAPYTWNDVCARAWELRAEAERFRQRREDEPLA